MIQLTQDYGNGELHKIAININHIVRFQAIRHETDDNSKTYIFTSCGTMIEVIESYITIWDMIEAIQQ